MIKSGLLIPKPKFVRVPTPPVKEIEFKPVIKRVKKLSEKYVHKLVLPMTPGMSYAEYLMQICKAESEGRRYHKQIKARMA